MDKPRARILLVEDDPAICRGLLDVFVFNGFSATGIEDGDEGLQLALDQDWDLLILDVMLPSRDGFSICRGVRKKKPGQAVIMLTAKGAENDVVTGFKAGADDYVTKPFSIAELMVRVEAVMRRTGKNLGNETVKVSGLIFDAKTLTLSCGENSTPLTRREMDIILFLSRNSDRIVSKKEFLTQVWQYRNPDVETRTVDIHIQKLRKKILSLSPSTPLIQTIRGEGYRLEQNP